MSTPVCLHSAVDSAVEVGGIGVLLAYSDGVPIGSTAGYAPGCLCIDTTNGDLYINKGTVDSSSWVKLSS